MNRFHFVSDHSDTYPVKRLCQVIDIARSSYYAWIGAADTRAARAAADIELAQQIRAIHKVDNTYGRPRITAEINDGQSAGQRVNHKRIARIMRANNIEGVRLRRRHRTTIAEPATPRRRTCSAVISPRPYRTPDTLAILPTFHAGTASSCIWQTNSSKIL